MIEKIIQINIFIFTFSFLFFFNVSTSPVLYVRFSNNCMFAAWQQGEEESEYWACNCSEMFTKTLGMDKCLIDASTFLSTRDLANCFYYFS